MTNLRLLIKREFGLFRQNKVFAAAFLVMPVVIAAIFGFVYQKGKVTQQPVIVVDRDDTPVSNRFRDMLEQHNTLHVIATLREALDLHQLLLNTKAVAVVVIPYRFEADLLTQKHPEVNCYLNMANTLTSGAVGSAISLCAGTMNAGILTNSLQKKGVPAALAMQQYEAFKYNTFFRYNPGGNYLYFLWPGFIFSTLQQLLLLALAVSFSGEFAGGTFNRSGLLGYSRSPVMLIFCKLFPYLLMSVWNCTAYFLLSRYFRVPVPAHPGVLVLILFLFITGTCSLAVCYSIINPLPLKASQLVMSVATPSFTLSGFTWPSSQAPEILVALGKIVPITPFLKALRMVMMQEAGFTDILPQLQHQCMLIAVYLALAMALLYTKIKKAV